MFQYSTYMYYILYGIFYLLSLLPWFIIYFLSDCIYVFVYYVFGYRKTVVRENLLQAFPEKSDEERRIIEKKFYHAFIDNFIEVIKFLSISGKTLDKRVQTDYAPLQELEAKGYNIEFILGHYFNWEFANLAYSKNLNNPFLVVYHPISSNPINKIFKKIRSRFGSILIASTNFKNEFIPYLRKQYSLILVGDQNTGAAHQAYWLPFFGKMAPFVKGPEKTSKAKNMAVVFVHIIRVKRGYYKCVNTIVSIDPKTLAEGELTKLFVQSVEEKVRLHPENYMWTHRRYKHVFTEEQYGHLVLK